MVERSLRTSESDSAGGFVHILLDTGLVSNEVIEQARHALANGGSLADDAAIAKRLLEDGHLTSYQANLIQQRKVAELVIGNYEILDKLGAGGMGAVFKARHRRMKRIVALKVLAAKLAGDATFVQRFQREVETIAQLSHPNVVMAFDADVSEMGHFLVMEFVDGRDLDSIVTKEGPMSVAAAVQCIIQTGRGLEYAHGRGIIHRDIKPANLLRDAQGVVKVTDLGLARFKNTDSMGGITQAGGIVGTIDFMPPEQAMDATQIDHRADIYSLGATLYFLLAGQPPYPERSLTAALLKHREAPIPSLRNIRIEVPSVLDDIFQRMMAKDPASRFQSMTEVLQALDSVQANLGSQAEMTGQTIIFSGPLPISSRDTDQATAQSQAQTQVESPRRAGLKVVLVEPSRVQSGIIRKYLQGQGIENVVSVASGKEALNAVKTEKPDVVVSALHLADMTGSELARQIRTESQAGAPGFVLISSEAEGAEAGSLSKYGNGMVLRKPFTAEKLAEALKVVAQPSPTRPERGKWRVLVVDDSTPARLHICSVLKGFGLQQITQAADGAQAVAALASGTFDIVVTDYNMPFMDGRGLVGYLRQNPATASVPIIMVTTETDPAKLDPVRQLGVRVCDKHFRPDVVRNILDQIEKSP